MNSKSKNSIKIAMFSGLIGGIIFATVTRSETTFEEQLSEEAFVERIEPQNLESVLGGEDLSFNASITMDTAGRFNLNIKNNQELPVTIRYGLEIIDDRGKSMSQAIISDNFNAAKDSQQAIQLDVQPGLPNAYYIIRTKIAFVGTDNIVNSTLAEAYLEVIDGKQNVITSKEFNTNSLINVAIIVNEGSK